MQHGASGPQVADEAIEPVVVHERARLVRVRENRNEHGPRLVALEAPVPRLADAVDEAGVAGSVCISRADSRSSIRSVVKSTRQPMCPPVVTRLTACSGGSVSTKPATASPKRVERLAPADDHAVVHEQHHPHRLHAELRRHHLQDPPALCDPKTPPAGGRSPAGRSGRSPPRRSTRAPEPRRGRPGSSPPAPPRPASARAGFSS